jgi:hypothetical protein
MRTIIYPHKVLALPPLPPSPPTAPVTQRPVYGRRTASSANTVTPIDPDDYLSRLGKHVPAEALATLLLLAGQLESHPLGWRLAAIGFTAMMAVVLDRDRRNRVPEQVRPVGLIYDVFVLVAFAGWALGTTQMARDLIGIDQAEASFITVVLAFLLARFDDSLGQRFEKKNAPGDAEPQASHAESVNAGDGATRKRRRSPRAHKTDN